MDQTLKETPMFRSLCDFYGCMRLPFDKSLPVRDLFPATAHQEIQARLAFAVQNHFPALVTGDVGSGKSTAVRAFIQSLDPNLYLTAYLPNPNLTIQALFAYILAAWHVSSSFHPRGLSDGFIRANVSTRPSPTLPNVAAIPWSSLTRRICSATACSTNCVSG